MIENSPNISWQAFNWYDLDNTQRHKVVKKFEEDYGPDFAHQAKFGNEYCKPTVKNGKLLSSKKSLTEDDIDYYCDKLLETIFSIRTARTFYFHMIRVFKRTLDKDTKFYLSCPFGCKEGAIYFEDEESANNDVNEFNRLFKHIPESLQSCSESIVLKKGSVVYDIKYFNNNGEWINLKNFPTFKNKKYAVDRAIADSKMFVCGYILKEIWNKSNYNSIDSYNPFDDNVFKFTKKDYINRIDSCQEMSYLKDVSYIKKLINPDEDTEFIQWCRDNL